MQTKGRSICFLLLILAVPTPALGQAGQLVSSGMRWQDSGFNLLASNVKKKSRRVPGSHRQLPERKKVDPVPPTSEIAASERNVGPAPRMTIEANPLGLLLGLFNVELNIKWNDHLTIGPVGSYAHYGYLSGFGVGGSAYYYFDSLFRDWFATGGGIYGKAKGSSFGYNFDVTTMSLYGMGGYKWLWPTFVASLGAGLQINQVSYAINYAADDGFGGSDTAPKPPIQSVGLSLMFNIGMPIY